MFGLLPIFAAIVSIPVGSAIWSAVRYRLDRRRLERAFYIEVGRERRSRPNPWRQ